MKQKRKILFLKLYLLATNSNYGMPPYAGNFHTGEYSTRNAFFLKVFWSSHLPSKCDVATLSPSPTLICAKLMTGTSRINQTSILALKRFYSFSEICNKLWDMCLCYNLSWMIDSLLRFSLIKNSCCLTKLNFFRAARGSAAN